MAILMTSEQYVNKLIEIVNLPTVYCNKYPKNLGYWDGTKYSFDCWNLIKAVLNGWTDTRVIGYYQKDLSKTGDLDGAGILKKCTQTSQDFTKISIPGTYLFMRNTHAGTFVGEYTINGKVYNTIECTAAWDKKVLWSYCDSQGNRRRYKDGPICCKWTDWGLMCWVDYTNSTPQPLPVPKVEVAKPTLRKGNKGAQVKLLQQNLESLGYSVGKYGCDGDFGDCTRSAVIAFQKSAFPDNSKEWDGIYGNKSYTKLKYALENN